MANNRYVMVEQQAFELDTFVTPFVGGGEDHAIDQISEDISEEHGYVYVQTSAKRLARNRLLGPRVLGGEVAAPLYTKGTPTLLYYALGAVTTTEPVPALVPPNYKHDITPGTSIPSFKMAVGKDLNEHGFVGCAMKGVKIDYSVGDPALCTFDLLIRKEITPPGTLQTPTFPDYDVKERTFLGVEVTVLVDAVAAGYVRSMSLDISNDLVEDNHAFGSRELPNLRVQGLEVSGTVTIAFDDIQRYLDVLDETESKFEFLFATGTLGTAGYRQVEIVLPKVSYDTAKLPTDSNKEYVLEVNFTAEIDPGVDEDPITINIFNDESASELIA